MPVINITTSIARGDNARAELSLPHSVMSPRDVIIAARAAGVFDFIISPDAFVIWHIKNDDPMAYRSHAQMPIIHGDNYDITINATAKWEGQKR